MGRMDGQGGPNGRAPALGAVAVGAVAVGAAAAITATTVDAARRDVHLVRTDAGPAVIHTLRDAGVEPVRVLEQGGVYQSATYLGERRFEPVFAYYRGFDAVFEANEALCLRTGHGVQRVLMLGGGGFSWPKHLLTTRSGIALDVVEVDAKVVRAARRWFFLGELEERLADPALAGGNALRVYRAEGRSYLEGTALRQRRYDAIVNDAFAGAEPARRLATLEAAQAARACLCPGGVYAVNVVSHEGGTDLTFLRDEAATLTEVFAHVHVLDISDAHFGAEANYLLIATDGDGAFPGAIPFDDGFLGRLLHDPR